MHVVLNKAGTHVLARLDGTVYFQPLHLAECVGHRYTIAAPSANAAEAMAVTYDGAAGVLQI